MDGMDTAEPRLLRVEVVADLPVLWATLRGLDFPATRGRHFPPPTHWKSPLSPGEVLALWLLFLVSQGTIASITSSLGRPAPGHLSALLGKDVRPTVPMMTASLTCSHDWAVAMPSAA